MANEKLEYKLVVKDLASGALKEISINANQADKALGKAKKQTDLLSGSFKYLAGYMTAGAIWNFGKGVVQTTAKFQSLRNAINTASETAKQGEINFLWIKNFSNEYGLEVESVAEGFKTLRGAMINTKFTSSDTRKMFEQVSTGIVALGLSSEDAKGTFLALGQMMGKGKVQAEELRGQIGERVPGAFAIAARAMNMTTIELDKFMQDGKLLAEDFLPKFANEMEKTFGDSAKKNAHGLTQEINRMSSAWTNLMSSIGETDTNGLMGKTFAGLSSILDNISDRFKTIEQRTKQITNNRTASELSKIEKETDSFYKTIKNLPKEQKSKKLESYSSTYLGISKDDLKFAESELLNFESKLMDKMNYPMFDNKKRRTMSEAELLIDTEFDKFGSGKFDDSDREKFNKLRQEYQIKKDVLQGASQYFDKKTSDIFDNKSVLNNQSLNNSSTSATKTARTSDIKNITINIGKMIEDLRIVTQSDSKIVSAIEKEVKKVIALAVNDFNALAN